MRPLNTVTLVTALLCGGLRPAASAQSSRLSDLAQRISARIASVAGAEVAVSFRDLATGDSLDLAADVSFHAASTMKIPVMLEVLRSVDEGRLRLDQQVLLVNRFHSIVDGSPYSLDSKDDGDSSMYARVGTRVAVRDLLERMIVRSSNLATNALVSLVGADQVTASARRLGAGRVQVLRGVEDGKAFTAGLNNTTTSSDLATLLLRIERGEALSADRAHFMRDVLLRQEFNDEIPAGIPPGVPVAHKTGSITATLHDAAIVYPPQRAPYVLVVLTRKIPDEQVARALIVDISRLVWAHAVGTPGTSATGAR